MPNRLIKRNHPTRSERPKTDIGESHSKHQSRHETKNLGKQEGNRVESKISGKHPETHPKTTSKDKKKESTKKESKHHKRPEKKVRFNLTKDESNQATDREHFPTARLHSKRKSFYSYDYNQPSIGPGARNRNDLHSIVPPKSPSEKERNPAIAESQARARARNLRNDVLTDTTRTRNLLGEDWPQVDGYPRGTAQMKQYNRALRIPGRPRGQVMPTHYAGAHPTLRTTRGDRSRYFGLGWLSW